MPNNCDECPLLPRVEALEKENEYNKQAHKEIYRRLEDSSKTIAKIEERLSQIREDTTEIKKTVRTMEAKPGKRWESLAEKTIWAVAAAVVAFLLGRLGL